MGHSHQPGLSHQSNKAKHSRHASKRALKNVTVGRVDDSHRPNAKAGFNANMSKAQRKAAAKLNKKEQKAE